MTPPLLTAAIFIASLQSFYIETLGGPVIPYIGGTIILIAAILSMILRPAAATVSMGALCITSILIFIALASAFSTGNYKSSAGIIFGGFIFLSSTAIIRERIDLFARAVRTVILLHIAFLLVQICFYYAFYVYIDYLYFTDDHAVWSSLKGWVIAGELVPRFTGAFNEPGSYSGVMGALVATYYYANRRADTLVWIVICSLVASAALTGAVLAAGLTAAIAWDYSKRLTGPVKHAVIFTSLAVTAAVIAFIFVRFSDRLQYTGGTQDAAFQNLAWLLDTDNMTTLGHSLSSLPGYVSAEYFGVWMSTYIQFGLSGLLALMTLLAPALFSNPIIFGTLLLAKVKITFPLIYILAAGVWMTSERSTAIRKREAGTEKLSLGWPNDLAPLKPHSEK